MPRYDYFPQGHVPRPHRPHRPHRPSGTAFVAALGLATIALAGCAAPAPTSPEPASSLASGASAAPESTAALPPSACGDDQPGRYFTEIFTPATVTTTEYTAGLKADVYQPTTRPPVAWVSRGSMAGASPSATGPAERSKGGVTRWLLAAMWPFRSTTDSATAVGSSWRRRTIPAGPPWSTTPSAMRGPPSIGSGARPPNCASTRGASPSEARPPVR